MKIIITESQLRKIVSSIISKQNNVYGIKQGMNLIYEGRRVKNSLEYIKKRIADATSLKDFKEKNPNWLNLYQYIRNNYKNDPYNNWKDLMSDFTKNRSKYTLDNIKGKIEDATSLIDFKEKNPDWLSMYTYIKYHYKNNSNNNWESLISHFKPSLNNVKKKIEDATSWEDFKQKNPQWGSMYKYIIRNYKNDSYNNWESLISVFEDAPIKQSLEHIKRKIKDATSWKDFKEKNPKAESMYSYINVNYKNDPYNNWEVLTSHFNNLKEKNFSLEYIKERIADATSLNDFKEKNPNWGSMYGYIRNNYKNDPYNNWKDLTSHFVK